VFHDLTQLLPEYLFYQVHQLPEPVIGYCTLPAMSIQDIDILTFLHQSTNKSISDDGFHMHGLHKTQRCDMMSATDTSTT
jgi:hypothetical protein